MWKTLAGFAVILSLSGCGILSPCHNETHVVEVEFGSAFFDIQLGLVQNWRDLGYNCNGETIRNAFGTSIGTKYTCTKCVK